MQKTNETESHKSHLDYVIDLINDFKIDARFGRVWSNIIWIMHK